MKCIKDRLDGTLYVFSCRNRTDFHYLNRTRSRVRTLINSQSAPTPALTPSEFFSTTVSPPLALETKTAPLGTAFQHLKPHPHVRVWFFSPKLLFCVSDCDWQQKLFGLNLFSQNCTFLKPRKAFFLNQKRNLFAMKVSFYSLKLYLFS